MNFSLCSCLSSAVNLLSLGSKLSHQHSILEHPSICSSCLLLWIDIKRLSIVTCLFNLVYFSVCFMTSCIDFYVRLNIFRVSRTTSLCKCPHAFTNMIYWSLGIISVCICSFRSLTCAEHEDSVPFAAASSILVCCVLFPYTLLHQLVFHPSSLRLTIYFSVYLSALLFANSYLLLFRGILLPSILCTCPNQRNLFSLIASAIVGFLTLTLLTWRIW